jgi:hypothetical protein
MWLCDREPMPADATGPVDIRNLHAHDLSALAPRYTADRLKIIHYLDRSLDPLTRFQGLSWLQLRWAPKLEDVSALATLSSLSDLVFEDCPKVRDLSPVAALGNLRTLSIAGGMWKPLQLDTLAWIPSLEQLETLEIGNVKLADGDVTVVTALPRLRSLKLANMWTMGQFARIVARFGPVLESPPLLNDLNLPCKKCGGSLALMIGKGARMYCRACDAARIERELRAFQAAVEAART